MARIAEDLDPATAIPDPFPDGLPPTLSLLPQKIKDALWPPAPPLPSASAQSGLSYRILSDVILARKDISPAAKLVMMTLQAFGRDGKLCFPGIETIADRCGQSASTVKRALGDLVKLGLISIVADDPRTPKGRRIDKIWMDDPTLHPCGPNHSLLGGQNDPLGGGSPGGGPKGQNDPAPRGSKWSGRLGGQNDSQGIVFREKLGTTDEIAGEGSAGTVRSSSELCVRNGRTPTSSLATRSPQDVPAPAPSPRPVPRPAVEPRPAPQVPPSLSSADIPTALPRALARLQASCGIDFSEPVPPRPAEPVKVPDEAAQRVREAFQLVGKLWRQGILFEAGTNGEVRFSVPKYIEPPTAVELTALRRLKPEVIAALREKRIWFPDTAADSEAAEIKLRENVAKLITNPGERDLVLENITAMLDLLKGQTKHPIDEIEKAIKVAIAAPNRRGTIMLYARGMLNTKIKEKTFS